MRAIDAFSQLDLARIDVGARHEAQVQAHAPPAGAGAHLFEVSDTGHRIFEGTDDLALEHLGAGAGDVGADLDALLLLGRHEGQRESEGRDEAEDEQGRQHHHGAHWPVQGQVAQRPSPHGSAMLASSTSGGKPSILPGLTSPRGLVLGHSCRVASASGRGTIARLWS